MNSGLSGLACLGIICYFLLLILVTSLNGLGQKYFQGRTIYLLRALLPSWKFFDDAGDYPKLFYRTPENPSWQPVLAVPARKWRHLFCNPEGSYLLACGSLLQQLVTDMEDETAGHRVESSVSYKLVKSLVEHTLKQKGIQRYQFKVCSISSLDPALSDDLMLSPQYEMRNP